MAKMRIFEIARSLQSKDKKIKSGDLVKLLNDNGFDVKGANSNIEDDAIAFLLKTFNNKKPSAKRIPGCSAANKRPHTIYPHTKRSHPGSLIALP